MLRQLQPSGRGGGANDPPGLPERRSGGVAGPAAWWGEQWWRAILHQIRTSRVFVFLISESWAQSKPCQAEYAYAKALGIPLLPVQVGDLASLRILPFGNLQMIDYRLASKDAFIVMLQSVARLSAVAWTTPAPPPPEPDVPYEYLMRLGDRAAAASLPPEAQIDLLDQIRRALEVETDERARQDLVGLLATLRGRSDITFRTATEADNLVASLRGGGSRPHTGAVRPAPDSGGGPPWNRAGTGAATPRVFLADAGRPGAGAFGDRLHPGIHRALVRADPLRRRRRGVCRRRYVAKGEAGRRRARLFDRRNHRRGHLWRPCGHVRLRLTVCAQLASGLIQPAWCTTPGRRAIARWVATHWPRRQLIRSAAALDAAP